MRSGHSSPFIFTLVHAPVHVAIFVPVLCLAVLRTSKSIPNTLPGCDPSSDSFGFAPGIKSRIAKAAHESCDYDLQRVSEM